MYGKVYFVGSGPGDPELLTIKALRLLESADVVIYDSLVTEAIISRIPARIDRIAIRKGPHMSGLELDAFSGMMVGYAKDGKTVVRLKSGDPLIFGRTWEEIEYLEREGIEYEIVPGITSALASAALSNTPLTDRRYSSSFAVVTGHEARGKDARSVDWKKLSEAVDTLIVLMGVATAPEYSRKLLDAGVERTAAVTLIYNVSRNDQKIVKTTLETLSHGLVKSYGDLCTVIISLRVKTGEAENTSPEPQPSSSHFGEVIP